MFSNMLADIGLHLELLFVYNDFLLLNINLTLSSQRPLKYICCSAERYSALALSLKKLTYLKCFLNHSSIKLILIDTFQEMF